MTASPKPSLSDFAARLLLTGIFAGVAAVLWLLRDLLAIAFGAMVLAVGFHGVANAIGRRTGLPGWAALTGSVLLCLAVAAGSLEVFGAAMTAQFGDLAQKLPRSALSFAEELRRSPYGAFLLEEGGGALRAGVNGSVPRLVARVIGMTAQGLTYALVMVAAGVFLAMEPARYRNGLLRLLPGARRPRYREVLGRLSTRLRRWLAGRIVVMLAVGVLTSLGLWGLGIDAPFALGLTGAVLTFIPLVGSIAAALPGMLIGFLQEPIKAVAVGLLFWSVHFVEGTFITPYVQDETVDIPPVLSVFSTIVFGLLFGPVGVILTGPFTVVAMVLVEALYIEDVLGEPPPPPSPKRRSWLRRFVGDR